jgi:DNA processing protein
MADRGLLDLIISRIPGLKRDDAKQLCLRFDREEDLVKLDRNGLEMILGHPVEKMVLPMDRIRILAEKDAAAAKLRGIKIVTFLEEDYPPLLKEIFDPPVLLYYRGELPEPSQRLVAVAGTRKPGGAASAQAFSLGRELGLAGLPVVSGLALGIDALAHRGNIEGGGKTIAVLGSGADYVYPTSNKELARRILDTGGCMLSEFPPGTRPFKWNFPARNRIFSGLCRGVVIVEAPERSGALITAAFAVEHNRDLWVASTGVASPGGKGTAKLAAEGAKIISSAKDILQEWNISFFEESDESDERAGGKINGASQSSMMNDWANMSARRFNMKL